MSARIALSFAAISFFVLTANSYAQQPAPVAPVQQVITPYGQPIDLETARRVVAGAEAEATKNGWPVAISVIDSTGHLVLFEKLDNTQYGSIEVATQKAVTAINYRRPGKAFQDAVAAGGVGLRILTLPGVSVYEGGYPLALDGKLVGAIGVSGVLPPQDDQVARAGVDALKAR
jgi:glc operon protein GlcG